MARLHKGSRVRWKSEGRGGAKWREGIVRGYLEPGVRARPPKDAQFKAAAVNSIHARYLVEIRRENKRSGRKLPSLYLAPKARLLERVAKTPK